MTVSPVKQLLEFGQSPWLDFIRRSLLKTGELRRMIDEWGIRGVTSNPVIFEKAIAHTDDYRAEIARLARAGKSAEQIYETLAFEDVRAAAELLYPIYRETNGADGFVSLEVSPHRARDALSTISEAKRLWSVFDRPNVMIKVPGTREGLTAIRSLLGDGVNINITLLFSIDRYREVLDTYFAGLEDALAAGRRIDGIASVASFFLSRIDTLIDDELDALTAAGGPRSREAKELRGEAAIASARVAYGILEESLASERFRRLHAEGAHTQRLLWASTGTKDPAYSAIKYVEPLVGPHTINTMPLETLKVYHDGGQPRARLTGHAETAALVLATLAAVGIDLEQATSRLLDEGIEKFARPYDALLHSLDTARQEALARALES
jgi:transaldolase